MYGQSWIRWSDSWICLAQCCVCDTSYNDALHWWLYKVGLSLYFSLHLSYLNLTCPGLWAEHLHSKHSLSHLVRVCRRSSKDTCGDFRSNVSFFLLLPPSPCQEPPFGLSWQVKVFRPKKNTFPLSVKFLSVCWLMLQYHTEGSGNF